MNKNDELLNKYIDGEVQGNELEDIRELLKNDEQVKNLKALQLVDNSLKTLEYSSAPKGITEKVIKIISATPAKIKLPKNYFTTAINAVFIAVIVGLLIYIFSLINWDFTSTKSDDQVNLVLNSFKKNLTPILLFFQNKYVMFWGSVLSLMALLVVYSMNEAHKAFKKRLENISMK